MAEEIIKFNTIFTMIEICFYFEKVSDCNRRIHFLWSVFWKREKGMGF